MSFVPLTIAATHRVAAGDSGLASGLLNSTLQVGGALGVAILTSVSASRVTNALHGGSAVPAALTHGFTAAFTVAGALCAVGAGVTLALLPRRQRDTGNGQHETIAMAAARCPARRTLDTSRAQAALSRRVRGAVAQS
jgi:hypothetical protein